MSLSLLEWRRTVAALYAEVRATADPEEGWLRWRAGRDRLFAEHPDSPLPPHAQAGFGGLVYAPYDPELRFELPVEPAEPARWEVPTATDGVVPFVRVGTLRLPGSSGGSPSGGSPSGGSSSGGLLGELDVWWLDSYGGGIFVPLRDASSGGDTYGGGRYLLDTVKGADLGGGDGRLVIDLNFAYNPSCAYDPAWVCPLPPPGNVLTAPVIAGELDPTLSI